MVLGLIVLSKRLPHNEVSARCMSIVAELGECNEIEQ